MVMRQFLSSIAEQTMIACYQLSYSEREMLPILRVLSNKQLLETFRRVDWRRRKKNANQLSWYLWTRQNALHLKKLKEHRLLERVLAANNYRVSQIGLILCQEVMPVIDKDWPFSVQSDYCVQSIRLLATEEGFKMLKLLSLRPWSRTEFEPVMATLAEFLSPLVQELMAVGFVVSASDETSLAITLAGRRVYQGLARITRLFSIEGARSL
jgi:hypothetical protein